MKYEIMTELSEHDGRFGLPKAHLEAKTKLEKAVNDKMFDGWECQGGMYLHVEANFYQFYQAMVKK